MGGAGKEEKHQRYPLSLMEPPYMTDSVEVAKRPDVLLFWSNNLLYILIQPFYFTLVIGRLFAPVVYGAGNFVRSEFAGLREEDMAKANTFTVKHYPVNDLLALDLQDHMDGMAKSGWDLVGTQQLINEHSSTTPQLIFFWAKDEE